MVPRRLEGLSRHELGDGLTVYIVETVRARLLGLALLRDFPAEQALLIPHCRSVHTFGMRFAIDVVFLDEHGQIARLAPAVGRGRVLSCRGAYAVLETRAGCAARFLAATPPRPPAARAAG